MTTLPLGMEEGTVTSDEEEEICLVSDSDDGTAPVAKDLAPAAKKCGCCPAWCNITAEPVLIIYTMSAGLRNPQLQALIYDKLCR